MRRERERTEKVTRTPHHHHQRQDEPFDRGKIWRSRVLRTEGEASDVEE